MGILDRFSSIMKSNINALLDKCEDPEKMIDQYLREALDNLEEVKKGTAEIMAAEKQAKDRLTTHEAEVEKWQKLAVKALQAGNEEDARTFIAKKQSAERDVESYRQAYDAAHAEATKMREMHDKLTDDISNLKSRREAIKAKVAVAKTYERVSKLSTSSNDSQAAIGGFARMEEKADRMLATATARAELDTKKEDAATKLEEKYSSVSVDEELAAMKAELGI